MRVARGRLAPLALTLTTALALASCGSSSAGPGSSASARRLLSETFAGSHPVTSGDIELSLGLTPSGSSLLSGPIRLAFGGPFQSGGAGRVPKSDFSVSASAQGRTGKLSLISTGTAGYITVSGASYQLPAGSYSKLSSGFSAVSGASKRSGAGILSGLGIKPLDWLTDPHVVGAATVAGAPTTQLRAGVNVSRLLADLEKLLGRTSSLGLGGAAKLGGAFNASARARLAREISGVSFEVWTGVHDHVLRRLQLRFTVPLSGKLARQLGGLRTVAVALSLQYSDINQPQQISAPAKLAPYAAFQRKIASVLLAVESAGLGGSLSSGGGSSAGSATAEQKYGTCIVQANGDVAKMQKCSSLLGG